jgi:hypothetical protein
MTQQILVPVPDSPVSQAGVPGPRRGGMTMTALLLDNSKTHGSTVLERVAEMLRADGWRLQRLRKHTASSPAPRPRLEQLGSQASVCFTALAD